MIFVTVGTEKFSFHRMIKVLDEAAASGLIKDELFGQVGTTSYAPEHFRFKAFLSFEQMVDKIKQAKIVIAHAGVGTSLLSLSLGKTPIIFPRRREFGEHLDDHQVEFAKKMDSAGRLIIAYDEKELIEKIISYPSFIKDARPASLAQNLLNLNFFR